MTWHGGPLAGFDLETKGTGPLVARIVTAAVDEAAGARRDARSRGVRVVAYDAALCQRIPVVSRVSGPAPRRRPAAHAGAGAVR